LREIKNVVSVNLDYAQIQSLAMNGNSTMS